MRTITVILFLLAYVAKMTLHEHSAFPLQKNNDKNNTNKQTINIIKHSSI